MKAVLKGRVIAESDDIVTAAITIFPSAEVRLELLEKSAKTASDLQCPHGVQFYDVVLDGERHPRLAWRYEAPRPSLSHVAGRFGFWQDVEVG